jgi:hypothetical protein
MVGILRFETDFERRGREGFAENAEKKTKEEFAENSDI